MSLTKTHNPSPANRHSKPNQSLIQQTAIQRAQNEKDNQTEHESDVQTAIQLKAERDPSSDFIRPNALVQAKLNIGKPNDKYEVEADQMADKVVGGATEKATKQTSSPTLQKKDGAGAVESEGTKEEEVVETDIQQKSEKENAGGEDETTVQEKPLSESITPVVQLKELPPIQRMTGEEEKIQTKCDSCGKSEEKLNVQKKCSACAENEKDVQKMDENSDESEVQTKLDASSESTEEVQQMADPQEEKIQTKCAACGKEETSAKLNVQQKCSKCESEEKVQQKSSSEGSSSGVESSLKSSKGKGSQMDDTTKGSMESGFGSDFSGVRVHTDSSAVQMNKELGSKAFTNGSDIYFNEGQYSPSSKSGQHLLAHELTHTVQQGAVPKGVQKKDDSENEEKVQTKLDASTEESSVQKMEGEEEKVQQATDHTIQKADEDPCAEPDSKDDKKSDEKAPEESQGTKDCKAQYIPAEDPGDRDEPDQDEEAKDIEAIPEMSADERQEGAPPVDAESTEEEGPQAENPLEICKKREEKQAEQGQAPGAGGNAADAANAGAGEDATPGQVAGAAAGGAAAGPVGEQAGNEGGGKKGEGEPVGLTESVEGGDKKQPPAPQGEMSSPAEIAKREQNMAIEAGAIGGVNATLGAITGMGATPIAFMNENKADNSAQDAMANSFLQDKSAKANSIVKQGLKEAEKVKKETSRRRRSIQAEVTKRQTASKTFFRQKAQESIIAAMQAKLGLNLQHSEVVTQIETKAATDIGILKEQFTTMAQDLQLKYMAQVMTINTEYGASYKRHIEIGKTNGRQAKQTGYDMARDYRSANVEGASNKDKNLVNSKEKDGFWDGYLTYNRYMARADSAKETGKQYQEGMETQGKEAADKLMCDKSKQVDISTEMAMQGIQNLQCAFDDAVESIELRKTATIGQAKAAKDEFTINIDAALKGTLAALKEKEVTQNLLISDYGARQMVALENISMQTTIGLYKGIQGMADDLKAQLEGFVASVVGNSAPDAADFKLQLEQSNVQFESILQATSSGISAAISSANSIIGEAGSKGKSIIRELYFTGINDGRELFSTYSALIAGIDAKRVEFFTQHLTTSIEGLQMDFDQGLARMQSVVDMVTVAFENVLNGLREKVKASEEGLQKGMTKTLGEDLKFKICSEAEKAAEEVQPWWKSVLKVLLVILVIVIVIALTVATAGAFGALAGTIGTALGSTLAGTMIAGAIAGAIFGALASFLITVGMNVINHAGTGKLTWESAFKGALDAAIQGAIAGAIGGMAGPLVGALNKGVGIVGKVLIEETVEIAFDMVGGILGDLVIHGEIKDWGNIIFGAVVARGIANGVKIAPIIKTKIKGPDAPATPKAGGDVGAPTKIDADAGGPPRLDADPGTTPKADGGGTPKADADAGTTPKADADGGTTPKTDADGGTTPKTDADGGTTPKTDADGGTTPKADADGGTSPKKLGDEQNLEATRSKNKLNEQEYELEKNAMEGRRPGKKIDQEINGKKYTEEVELPNGHKWRKRTDGGWCRFSESTCFPAGELTAGQKQAKSAGLPEKPPEGYQYYKVDGQTDPGIRRIDKSVGEPKVWDRTQNKFIDAPEQKTRFKTDEVDKTTIKHDDLDGVKVKDADGNEVGFKEKVDGHAADRKAAQGKKQRARSDAKKSEHHGKMVRDSEALGDTATEAVIKKKFPGATDLEHSLPGAQKSGEFDRIVKNGDEVIIIEAKGAGSTRGGRKVDADGTRAEQGTPEYRDSIIKNMEDSLAKNLKDPKYKTDVKFKGQVDDLVETVKALRKAKASGKIKYMQVTQKVKADGTVKPEVEIITFGNKSIDTQAPEI